MLLATLVVVAYAQLPSDVECQVCEDVVQTFHDRYRCAGEYLDFEHFRACDGPAFSCSNAPDAGECERMRSMFQTDPARGDLWKTHRVTGNAYKTCVALHQCPAEPTGNSACMETFAKDSGCRIDPTCSAVKVCTSSCYTCVRLVQEWPIFLEACSPPNANINDEAEFPNPSPVVPAEAVPNSFSESTASTDANGSEPELAPEDRAFIEDAASGRVEFNAATADRARRIQSAIQSGAIRSAQLQRAAEAAAAGSIFSINPDLPAYADPDHASAFLQLATTIRSSTRAATRARAQAGSTPASRDVRGGVDRETIQKACFGKYTELADSRRARYFMSYKRSTMPSLNPDDLAQSLTWDAHSTCKCLKAGCPMQPGETISLAGTCQYNRMHDMMMKIAFPTVSSP